MKRTFFFVEQPLSLFCLFSCCLVACNTDLTKLPPGSPIRADVVTFDPSSVSKPSDVPKFIYGPQNFKQLNNIDNLSGPRFRLLVGGDLEVQEAIGSVITASEFSGYTVPSLQYRVVDGVVKPADSKSLSMLSASYQFDTLIEKVEALSGKSQEEFFAGFNGFSVLFHPSIQLSEGSEKIRKYENSNAAYVAGAKQFALFFLGRDERVPMSFNPQIIAHEFGHAIFEKSFFNNKFERCTPGEERTEKLFPGRIESEFSVRGLNEGFADFVSFVWTGSSNILQSAIGEGTTTRERDFVLSGFDYDNYTSRIAEVCQGRFYCLGTLWARTLFDVYSARGLDVMNRDTRMTFLREVVSLMEKVGSSLRANDGARLPEPDDRTSRCLSRDSISPVSDGEMLAAFFKALVENAEPSTRKQFCISIQKYFGISGFPLSARGSCK